MTPTPRHTPGPWWPNLQFVAAADPEGRQLVVYVADTIPHVSEARVSSLETRRANARLIAAAPDLFTLVYQLAFSGVPVTQMLDDARALVENVCGDGDSFRRPYGTEPLDWQPVGPTDPRGSEHDEDGFPDGDKEHVTEEVHSDHELWYDICNDPAIWPENRAAAYRAALRGERNWQFASADDVGGGEATEHKTAGRNLPPPYLRRVK
jgi:hypothetical protein